MNLSKAAGTPPGNTPASVEGSSPQHQAVIQSSLDIRKRFQLDLFYRYVSALPAQVVPAYSTADARLGWRWTRHVEFSVAGRNLLQPRHVEFGSQVAIRREVFASLAWK
jgi:iron complex outermembrane receptor protein